MIPLSYKVTGGVVSLLLRQSFSFIPLDCYFTSVRSVSSLSQNYKMKISSPPKEHKVGSQCNIVANLNDIIHTITSKSQNQCKMRYEGP